MNERHRTDFGKWSQKGVPHKGWECTFMREYEDHLVQCEMCECAMIRYAFIMMHPEYPEALAVGCICAGNMMEDLVGAERRETEFKNRIKRRMNFPNLEGWRLSKSYNYWINVRGTDYRVVIFETEFGKYKAGVYWHTRRRYSGACGTLEEAQRAGFDVMMDMEDGV